MGTGESEAFSSVVQCVFNVFVVVVVVVAAAVVTLQRYTLSLQRGLLHATGRRPILHVIRR